MESQFNSVVIRYGISDSGKGTEGKNDVHKELRIRAKVSPFKYFLEVGDSSVTK